MARMLNGPQGMAELGDVTYNGFEFPPAINSSVTMQPVYDRSDRGLMYVKYSIRIEFIVYLPDLDQLGIANVNGGTTGDNWQDSNRLVADTSESKEYMHEPGGALGKTGSIDHQMHFLRRRLVQPGRRLTIAGLGIGPDLDINRNIPYLQGQQLHDVVWGPKPRTITWESLGANAAARVVWECEVGLVECETLGEFQKERQPLAFGSPEVGGALPVEILQVVYNANWGIDEQGMTTRSYEAVLQIRGYVDLDNLTNVLRSADEYRVFFEPPLQKGYLRTRKYVLNDDKTTMGISIVDKEVDSDFPYPPGLSKCDVSYSVSSSLLGQSAVGGIQGFRLWDAQLSGNLTMTKGFHPYWRRIYPYYLSLIILRSRYTPNFGNEELDLQEVAFNNGGVDNEQFGAIGDSVLMLPLEYAMREAIFGRDFGFDVRWLVICKPEVAPRVMRFGYPPNIYQEHQEDTTDFDNVAPNGAQWDWNMWIESMIGAGGASVDDDSWGFHLFMRVPGANVAASDLEFVDITLLEDWGIKRAPMSLSGADNRRFEGDARMEPCQPTPDFWFQSSSSNMMAQSQFINSSWVNTVDDSASKLLVNRSEMELTEYGQVVNVSSLNNPDDHTPIAAYVDGENPDGGVNGTRPVVSGAQSGAVAITHVAGTPNHVGDTDGIWNFGSQHSFGATDDKATKMQSLGSPKYQLHLTGYAVTMGKPLDPPRASEFGISKAVRSGSRPSVSKVTQLSSVPEVWSTSWDIWYDLLGAPEGIEPKLSSRETVADSRKQKSPIYTEGLTGVGAARRMG